MSAQDSAQVSTRTMEWLRTLIGYKTVSGSDSNLELLECVEATLLARGFQVRYSRSPDGARANLFASIGRGDGGLLFSGHTDVVPTTGQEWSRPEFTLTEEQDRLYGRGTTDMKGYIAAVLAAVESFPLENLRSPLHVALTYDEEIGCVGVRGLLADLSSAGIRPAACVVGEPTRLQVVRAHKGRHSYRCHVRGRAAHSSLAGLGINALVAASRVVGLVSHRADMLKNHENDQGFYVPYSTMAPCRLLAGNANNVIPEAAEFDFDLRFLPSTDPDDVMAPIINAATLIEGELRTKVEDASVRIERRTAVPALAEQSGSDAVAEMALRAGAQRGANVAFTTEGGLYQQAGIPTIICGPGDIAQAHTADEYIERSQLAAANRFVRRMLDALSQ